MRGASLVLVLASAGVGVPGNVGAQDKVLRALAVPAVNYRSGAPMVNGKVHEIPLCQSYEHYLHQIPLSQNYDHYLREIPSNKSRDHHVREILVVDGGAAGVMYVAR